MLHRAIEEPQAHESDPTTAEFMSIEDAIARYRDEWVLMYVVEWDEHHLPQSGHVLAHSPKRDDLTAVLAKQPPPSWVPSSGVKGTYYPFYAVPRVRSGPAYEAAIRQFIADFEMMKQREHGAGTA